MKKAEDYKSQRIISLIEGEIQGLKNYLDYASPDSPKTNAYAQAQLECLTKLLKDIEE